MRKQPLVGFGRWMVAVMDGWTGGWVGGWVGGLVGGRVSVTNGQDPGRDYAIAAAYSPRIQRAPIGVGAPRRRPHRARHEVQRRLGRVRRHAVQPHQAGRAAAALLRADGWVDGGMGDFCTGTAAQRVSSRVRRASSCLGGAQGGAQSLKGGWMHGTPRTCHCSSWHVKPMLGLVTPRRARTACGGGGGGGG